MKGIIVGIVTKVVDGAIINYEVIKKDVGEWKCTCSVGNAPFPCKHKRLVWAGKNKKGVVKIIERKALKRGWMPSAN